MIMTVKMVGTWQIELDDENLSKEELDRAASDFYSDIDLSEVDFWYDGYEVTE